MLYLIAWLTDFAAVLFIFAGTRLLAEQGAGDVALGWAGVAFFLSSAVSNACAGRLSDRWGRRRVATCGMALFLGSLSLGLAAEAEPRLFYAAYMSVGVALGMIYPPVIACVGGSTQERVADRAFLLFCVAFNLGMVSGQLSGGWLFRQLGFQAPVVVAIVLVTGGLICIRFLREPTLGDEPTSVTDPGSIDATRAELARALASLSGIANFGGMFSMSLLWFLFPQLVVVMGVPADAHGGMLAIGRAVAISTFCTMFFFPAWKFRFRFAAATQLCGAIGLLLLATATNAAGLAAGIVCLSLLMGYNYFASLFYNAVGEPQRRKGRAFGRNEAWLALGAAGGSWLGGYVGAYWGIRTTFQLAAAVIAALLIVQWLLLWRWVRPLKQLQRSTAAKRSPTESTAARHEPKLEDTS